MIKFIPCAVGALLMSSVLSGCSMPRKYIHTDIVVEAPPQAVWAVLADNERYPEWNPYHVRVDGTLEQGNQLEVELHKPNGEQLVIHPHVMRIDKYRQLDWGGGISGIFTGEHSFRLYEVDTDEAGCTHTRLVQDETFAGLVLPFLSLDAIEEGYQNMNLALKQRVEKHTSC
tara:strand:+ start:218 stop:733 length:516 start_codon:yes stop_codon:yes gene_type:complete